MPRRRPTRTTLRGWTRGLPPMAACFGLMFLFVWFEGQLVRNNTRANDLKIEILEVDASIAKLEEQKLRLKRMERMEQEGPEYLIEAVPGQIISIQGEEREPPLPSRSQTAARKEEAPTRSVVFRLLPSDHGGVDTTLQHEVAQRQPQE